MYVIARQSIAKTEPETPDVGWVQKMMEKAGIIKSFQETLDSEIERIKKSPMFIMSMMEQEFWKNIDWGTESNEQLTALAESMEGAIKYIKETIEKANDDTQNVFQRMMMKLWKKLLMNLSPLLIKISLWKKQMMQQQLLMAMICNRKNKI
jgi:hypothetical protein